MLSSKFLQENSNEEEKNLETFIKEKKKSALEKIAQSFEITTQEIKQRFEREEIAKAERPSAEMEVSTTKLTTSRVSLNTRFDIRKTYMCIQRAEHTFNR